MSSLTKGRTEPCKDSQGSLKEVWLATFIPYGIKNIVGYKNMLLTSFPTTLMYRFYGRLQRFDETLNSEMGYDQEVFMRLTKQTFADAALLDALAKNKVRAIVVDFHGNQRVAGLHNGLDVDVTAASGGSKQDYNGYELSMTGIEPYSAPDIATFPGAGFEKENVNFDCLLASSDRPASLSDKVASCEIVT